MIYLDYQATTPLAPEARAAMLPWLEDGFGNPHSPHRMGREAAAAVEVARGRVLAALLHQPEWAADMAPLVARTDATGPAGGGAEALPGVPAGRGISATIPAAPRPATGAAIPARTAASDDIGAVLSAAPAERVPARSRAGSTVTDAADGRLFFTSGATEAANWALKGSFSRLSPDRPKIVVCATDHSCVLDTARWLGMQGAEAIVLPVNRGGLIDPAAAGAAIDGRTAIVAVTLVNNEIGVVQPVAAIGRMARAAGAIMLCDAAQALGRVAIPVAACDLVTLSAHKAHGPKGIGALWVRNGCEPEPLMHGGGQEGGIRSGTLSPALCAGFGVAADLAMRLNVSDHAHVAMLHARLRAGLGADWQMNGDMHARYAGNLNVRRDGVDAARLISELRGIAFSAGSACASGSGRPSHVLKAIGLTDAQARSSIRLGFGRYTTAEEVDAAAAMIVAAADAQRAWAA